MSRGALLPSLLLLVAGWALTLWIAPWSDERVNDLFVYRSFAEPLVSGALPYRDFPFEYPPLAVPAIGLPGIISTAEEPFRWAYAVWTLLGAAAVVVLCGALARATGAEPRRAMLAAALMPLLCGALLRTHFDLFPVALLLGALLLLCRGRPRTGMAVLALGVMTKAFPLVAVPVALAWLVARGERRAAWQSAAACAAVIAAIAAAAVAVSPGGALDAVRYHLDRPAQIESSPALVVLGLDAAGLGEAVSVSSHGSDGVLHPAADAVSTLLLAALAGLVALLCAWTGRTPRDLVTGSLAAVVGFVVLGKVLSPQFVIWVLPLGALAFAWRAHALAGAVAVAALLTLVEFPVHYLDVVAREPLALTLVAVRNLVLLGVVLLAVRALQARGHQQLLDTRGTPVAVGLD